MSPFTGSPIGFSPDALALLDAALNDIRADFQQAMTEAPTARTSAPPVASEIDISRNSPPKRLAQIVARKRTARKAAGNLRFNKVSGWHLS